MYLRPFVSARCPIALSSPASASRYARINFGHWIPASASSKPRSRSNEITRSNSRVSMQMLSVANCWPPIECRYPETEIGKPFRDAERTISASSSLVCGLRSSRTRVRLSCEWTSLTQISFSRSAKVCGASAKSAAVRMNSRRVTIAGA